MKYFFSCVVLLLFVIILLFGIETISRYEEIERQLQTERFENQKKIEAIEKELRLIKQDICILENGYDGQAEEQTQFQTVKRVEVL